MLVSLSDSRSSAAAWPVSPHQFCVLVSLSDNRSSAAVWPVSAQLFCLSVSPARVHSCAVVQYLSLRWIGQRGEPCLAVAAATVILSVHQSPLCTGACLTFFSAVVVPLYHLASRNDRMQYDAPQDSCYSSLVRQFHGSSHNVGL